MFPSKSRCCLENKAIISPPLRAGVSFAMAWQHCLVRGILLSLLRLTQLCYIASSSCSSLKVHGGESLETRMVSPPAWKRWWWECSGADSPAGNKNTENELCGFSGAGMKERTCFRVAIREEKAAFMSHYCWRSLTVFHHCSTKSVTLPRWEIDSPNFKR